jgi:DNA-binding response OmpR family regulator
MAHRLLLADDSITIQKVVELVLAEEDFEIKSVGNGEDALNAMGTFNPAIVLADIDMPRMNGYQLCEKIKKNPATSGIPVILLAGAFEPIDEDLAREVGADDSIVKPFESQELISKINSTLTMISAEGLGEMSFAETEEEALEIMEETEAVGGPEAVELTGAEDDLWSMEGVSDDIGTLDAEAIAKEEQIGIEEVFEIPEEDAAIAFAEPIAQPKAAEEVVIQDAAMPSKGEMLKIYEQAVREKVNAVLSSTEIRDSLLSSLMPSMKDSLEKILWEVTPDLVEKMLKEVLKGSISSITGQIEKVIWETVPDLAGTMISKEIEKIKSEF